MKGKWLVFFKAICDTSLQCCDTLGMDNALGYVLLWICVVTADLGKRERGQKFDRKV